LIRGPEPAVDVLGEKVGTIATVEITKSPGGPEVWDVAVDESFDPVVFLLGFKRDEIHATFPAVVPGVEPVPLSVPDGLVSVLPAEPVQVTSELLHSGAVHSVAAEKTVWKAEFSSSYIFISSTVTREYLFFTVSLGRLRSVVSEPVSSAENVVEAATDALKHVLDRAEEILEGVEELGVGGMEAEEGEEERSFTCA
jgi:hypothetical protein